MANFARVIRRKHTFWNVGDSDAAWMLCVSGSQAFRLMSGNIVVLVGAKDEFDSYFYSQAQGVTIVAEWVPVRMLGGPEAKVIRAGGVTFSLPGGIDRQPCRFGRQP